MFKATVRLDSKVAMVREILKTYVVIRIVAQIGVLYSEHVSVFLKARSPMGALPPAPASSPVQIHCEFVRDKTGATSLMLMELLERTPTDAWLSTPAAVRIDLADGAT